MKRQRTWFFISDLISRRSVVMNSFISRLTSSSGRCQFSCEKANMVNTSTPAFEAARTTRRAERTPA